jgi:hypothetical protein
MLRYLFISLPVSPWAFLEAVATLPGVHKKTQNTTNNETLIHKDRHTNWKIGDGREFHEIMALYKTVRRREFVLNLGTVKRPLVACHVLYVWVSEMNVIWLCRQSGFFVTVLFLIETWRSSYSLVNPQPGKTGRHVVDVSSVYAVKGKVCCSVLSQTLIKMGQDQSPNN